MTASYVKAPYGYWILSVDIVSVSYAGSVCNL